MPDTNAVHRAAAEGFARGTEAYERGRPGYSPQALSWLAAQLDRMERPGGPVCSIVSGPPDHV